MRSRKVGLSLHRGERSGRSEGNATHDRITVLTKLRRQDFRAATSVSSGRANEEEIRL